MIQLVYSKLRLWRISLGRLLRLLVIDRKKRSALWQLKRLVGNREAVVIFDVGGHRGESVEIFHGLFPKARIFSFEPFADSFEVLKAKSRKIPECCAFNYAVSNRNGTARFFVNESTATSSLLESSGDAPEVWTRKLETSEVIEVPTHTLDSVAEGLRIDEIALLKLDVQGAEKLVMEGAADWVHAGRVKLVYCEIIVQPAYEGQPGVDEMFGIFMAKGFRLYGIYNEAWSARGELLQFDAIFEWKGVSPSVQE